MMSGKPKANSAIKTASETSPPTRPGTPPPGCAVRGLSTPPHDSPAAASSPADLSPHTSTTAGKYHPTPHTPPPTIAPLDPLPSPPPPTHYHLPSPQGAPTPPNSHIARPTRSSRTGLQSSRQS
ncbi:unnamed protein product, partial [Pleuronectes platessa]